MTWQDRLRQEVPRTEIPAYLTDLQALVAALREGQPWQELVTARLRRHRDLTLDYLGPRRDEVERAWRPHP